MFTKDYLKDNLIFLDGGMGTLLQENGLKAGELPERWNVTHADVITKIHKEYFDAGSNVVATNTFGANILKFSSSQTQRGEISGIQRRCMPRLSLRRWISMQ